MLEHLRDTVLVKMYIRTTQIGEELREEVVGRRLAVDHQALELEQHRDLGGRRVVNPFVSLILDSFLEFKLM